jgi:hypothetical protein
VSDEAAFGEPRRRVVTLHRVLVAVAVAIMAAGAAVLVLPYSKTVDLDLGGAGLIDPPPPVSARCEAPLLDAFHGEPEGWLNYSPGSGDAGDDVDTGGTLSGSWCTPQSVQRGALGASLIVFAMCSLLTLEVLRQRRIRQDRVDPETPPDPTAPTATATSEETTSEETNS